MKRITVTQIQKLVDQCSGYNLSFIQCLTKEINLLIASNTGCDGDCRYNEPEPKIKTTITVGQTESETCDT